MASTAKEIQFGELPKDIANRVAMQFLPDEAPVMVCHVNARGLYYILTGTRAISVEADIREINTIHFADVDHVSEHSLGQKGISYDLYNKGAVSIIRCVIENDYELALKFGRVLYQAINAAKSSKHA